MKRVRARRRRLMRSSIGNEPTRVGPVDFFAATQPFFSASGKRAIAPAPAAGVGKGLTGIHGLSCRGEPLSGSSRMFFSSRMGYDFSHVRVHADSESTRSARVLDARAYTVGNHVVFGEGEYNMQTVGGKKLMAHELAHVKQQAQSPSPKINRMKIGSGPSPELCGSKLLAVPSKERGTIEGAIARVGEVARNPAKYPDCHDFFAKTCPGGNKDSLRQTFDKVSVWKKPPTRDELAGASVCMEDTDVMAYSYVGYAAGEERLASYFMHELMHNCGIQGAAQHNLADKARLYCMGPGRQSISISAGKADDTAALALTYRRFLTEWRSGRIQPYAGLAVNLGLNFQKGEDSQISGGGLVGLQNRFGAFGGERFGGLTLGGAAGIGFGRFAELPAGEARRFGWDAGLIMQLHGGVEFAIAKSAEGRVQPLAVEANLSVIRPLTSRAETIQQFTVGVSVPF